VQLQRNLIVLRLKLEQFQIRTPLCGQTLLQHHVRSRRHQRLFRYHSLSLRRNPSQRRNLSRHRSPSQRRNLSRHRSVIFLDIVVLLNVMICIVLYIMICTVIGYCREKSSNHKHSKSIE